MKVIYSNGSKKELYGMDDKLYIKGRLDLKSWKELLDTMNELDIIKFEDNFVKQFGVDFISKEYVINQIKHLSF